MTIIIAILISFSQAHANPSCATPPKKTSALSAICDETLPKCIPIGKNFEGSAKAADVIKQLTVDISDDELFTRLIFAESLASGCDIQNEEIYGDIAWVLKNRTNRKDFYGNKSDRGVVLKPSQFSSSTGPCDVAKRKEFLCPTSYPGFDQAWIKASKAWAKTKTGKNPIPTARHYFFPKHFDNSKQPNCAKWKGVLPAWATKANTVKAVNSCATFHNVKE